MKSNIYQTESRNHFNKNDIYSKRSNGSFFSPFSLSIDDMEQLILINFEKNPDEFYNVFELQQARDKKGKERFLVIAYRKEGAADVYHQTSYPFASQAGILNETTFIESPLEDTKFMVTADCLDVFFAFQDKFGREVKVKVNESGIQKKTPFFLLAPVGVISKKPGSLPVYSLYEMSFTRQKYTNIEIEIDKVKHRPDTFPLPVNWSRNYFTRFSPDTFNVDLNKNFEGLLTPLIPVNNEIEDSGITYQLVDNCGHYEIKRMTAKNKRHQIVVDIFPPIPDIVCLNDDIHIDGNFTIATDKSSGIVSGGYHLEKRGGDIELRFQPKDGWHPNEKRWILKLLFLVVKVFREWPKSYVWNAKITLNASDQPFMKSGWKRITHTQGKRSGKRIAPKCTGFKKITSGK